MMRLNSYGHDESQYLPVGVPPINPFRAQHGNLKWVERTIHAKTWFPDILHLTLDENGKELISRQNLDTCIRIFKAYVATNQALGISDMLMQIASSEIEGMPRPPKDIYFALISRLLPYQMNLCLWVVCNDRNKGNIALARHLKGSIGNALDLAQNIIDNLKSNVNMNEPASPEVSKNYG